MPRSLSFGCLKQKACQQKTDATMPKFISTSKSIRGNRLFLFPFTKVYRTSVKEIQTSSSGIQSGSIVWGEYFEFPFLPDIRIETIRLHIYRESDKKKHRKDKDYIGTSAA
jgi:hypothetical protein